MRSECALVTFVKTPGVSPVKTRLAREIGSEKALEFYDLSLRATEARAAALMASNPSLAIYWAVAEPDCLDAEVWSRFPRVGQGEGGLGNRLAHVYEQVLARHPLVCFMGADSPHITANAIASCMTQAHETRDSRFHIGPTRDGGFYFFGGGIPLPTATWQSVSYSNEGTARELIAALAPFAATTLATEDFDIDEKPDLDRLAALDPKHPDLLSEQSAIIRWARSQLSLR